MTKKHVLTVAVLAASLVLGGVVRAQNDWSQTTACPGWNNPANFGAGNTTNYYQAQIGEPQSSSTSNPVPNALTAHTGITWQQTFNRSAIASVTENTSGDCATVPTINGASTNNKPFVIMSTTTQAGSAPVNRDPMTGNQLPFVPTQYNTSDSTQSALTTTEFTRSIRIGDACGGHNADGLYYYVDVTTDNAMFYIYYSAVVEVPSSIHGAACDPTFIIRVMKQNAAGDWVQASPTRPNLQTHNDSLSYYVSSTPATGSYSYGGPGSVVIGQNGWHESNSGYHCFWKEWDKVAVNLSPYLWSTVRIELIVFDCCMTQHFAYAYVAGECRPLLITSAGCPPGLSTDVTTLSAPIGLRNYVWYASDFGMIGMTETTNPTYTWRQLTPDNGPQNSTYHAQASDFHITRRLVNDIPTIVDSVGNWQTFRCKMTSALDPQKPIDSYLHVSVQNTKPSMDVDSLLMCDGTVKLWNRSEVPGDPSLIVPSSTRWQFYSNASCLGEPEQVLIGDSAQVQYDNMSLRGVRVRSYTTDAGCYSDAIYRLAPRQNPKAGMTISKRVLCDSAQTTLVDTTSGANNTRFWYFRPQNAPDDDMTLSDMVRGSGTTNRSITRGFTHGVEPIELTVRNGLYYTSLTNIHDTTWCSTTVRDTVAVFLHPELEVTGDTVVCEGSRTNATVRALGVDSCTYQWSTTPGTITGNIPSGPVLQVVPYADKATYFVKVTSPQGCVAWDSIHAYMVRPKLTMLPEDGRICPGDAATLSGSDADHFTWTASPSDPSLAGQDSANTIVVRPSVTTTYTMVGHGTNDCDATPLRKTVTIVPLPVPRVKLTPEFVDSEKPTVVLRDESSYSVSSSWLFNDGTTAEGKEVSHEFKHSVGLDSVHVVLTSYNSLNCPTEYPFGIPVNIYTAWFPTVFTPGSNDGNDFFSLYTINEYEYFHIYIYNRRGELVYESDDVHFRWDGTYKGEPCPQGAYVYTCRFRKPGTTTLAAQHGSITLIR